MFLFQSNASAIGDVLFVLRELEWKGVCVLEDESQNKYGYGSRRRMWHTEAHVPAAQVLLRVLAGAQSVLKLFAAGLFVRLPTQ